MLPDLILLERNTKVTETVTAIRASIERLHQLAVFREANSRFFQPDIRTAPAWVARNWRNKIVEVNGDQEDGLTAFRSRDLLTLYDQSCTDLASSGGGPPLGPPTRRAQRSPWYALGDGTDGAILDVEPPPAYEPTYTGSHHEWVPPPNYENAYQYPERTGIRVDYPSSYQPNYQGSASQGYYH